MFDEEYDPSVEHSAWESIDISEVDQESASTGVNFAYDIEMMSGADDSSYDSAAGAYDDMFDGIAV